MGVTCYRATNDLFLDASSSLGLGDTVGSWYCIAATDFDNDSDENIIDENTGFNNKFHPTKSKPLHIFSNDFEKTERLIVLLGRDEIIAHYYN